MIHHYNFRKKGVAAQNLTENNSYAKINKAMVKQKKQKPVFTRLSPLIAGAVIVVSGLISPVVSVKADTYDDQIAQKQAEQAAAQAQADKLGAKADTIEGQIEKLQNQIAAIQAKIDSNTAKKNDLTKEIDKAQKRLEEQKDLLSANIRSMYIEGDITPLEMLASSKNLSDFVDQQEYRDRIRENITNTLDEIDKLKKQLDDQRQEITKILDEQKSLRGNLEDKNHEADAKLSKANQSKASFDRQVSARASEIANLQAQQAAALAAVIGSGGSSPVGGSVVYSNLVGNVSACGGGYAYCRYGHDEWVDDSWGLHLARECVHYAAWAVTAKYGKHIPRDLFAGGVGSAYQWWDTVKRNGAGYIDNNNRSPGTVVYMPIGTVGHVAVIDKDYGNGWVRVSQYNFDMYLSGLYSTMDVKITPNLQLIHFR